MKTKLTLMLMLVVCTYVVQAQHKGTLLYKKIVDDKQTLNSRTENYIVYFDGNKSIELLVPANINESGVQTGENTLTKTINFAGGKRKQFVYKDFEKQHLSVGDNIDFKFYLIDDTLANFKWKITNEHQKILKYNCTKATTNFRGRVYTAWFTDDVPIQNGPWKFCGLPGLIVKVSDAENMYWYELESLDFKTEFDSSVINVPQAFKDDVPLVQKDFIKLFNKKVEDLARESKASVFINGNISGSSKRSISPKMEKF